MDVDDLSLHMLDTALEIAKARASRSSTKYSSMRPYLRKIAAVLDALQTPSGIEAALAMIERFDRDTGAGEWLFRAVETRGRGAR
jgi:hypothetical protein